MHDSVHSVQPQSDVCGAQPEVMVNAPAEWRVWLSWPPSVNNLYPSRIVRGRVLRVPSGQYRRWMREALVRIAAARLPRLDVPVDIEMALTAPDRRRRDASNYLKAIEDALVKGRVLVGDDQRYVRSARGFWTAAPSRKAAGVWVVIKGAA